MASPGCLSSSKRHVHSSRADPSPAMTLFSRSSLSLSLFARLASIAKTDSGTIKRIVIGGLFA
jgi:hypothetical protein